MSGSAFFDVLLHAADDPDFRERLIEAPDAVGRALQLGRDEQRVIGGMAKYALRGGSRRPLDTAEVSELLAVFMKLAVQDPVGDPDLYGRLREAAAEFERRAGELSAKRLDMAARQRGEAEACAQMVKLLSCVALAVMLIVLLLSLFTEPEDPPTSRPPE